MGALSETPAAVPAAAPNAAAPVEIDLDLIRRFGLAGPRYTSYPTADRFGERFDGALQAEWLGRRQVGALRQPLSVYVHIPFCQTVCYYCACNKVVTRERGRSTEYVDYLLREIDLAAPHLGTDRRTTQLHFGGGTPTYLLESDMRRLIGRLDEVFEIDPRAERAIELDPRTAPPATVALLASLGFNRASLGVQDFDPAVQEAVHRIQPAETTMATLAAARAHGFESINFDLIYGLPRQTVSSFRRTLDRVLEALPDRIALYNYAHLPERFKPQRRINAAELPDGETRLAIFLQAMRALTDAGYVYIGLDHFARPDDELAVAQRVGRLHRNFQGYSTRADCDLLALGVSAISKIGPTYSQNARELPEYYRLIDAGRLPVVRGMTLSRDDLARRAIIMALMCHGEVSMEAIELAYLVDFRAMFAREMAEIDRLAGLGLVRVDDGWIAVTPRGRFFVRVVAMVFDRYLRESATTARYSKVV